MSKKILLVIDDEVLLDFFSKLFYNLGHDACCLKKHDEALEYFKGHSKEFTLVIIDNPIENHAFIKELADIKKKKKINLMTLIERNYQQKHKNINLSIFDQVFVKDNFNIGDFTEMAEALS